MTKNGKFSKIYPFLLFCQIGQNIYIIAAGTPSFMCKTPQAKPKSGACPPKLHPFSAESRVKNKKISSWWRKQDEITEFIHDNEVMHNVIFDNKQFRCDRVWVKFAENIGVPNGRIISAPTLYF